MSFEEVVGRLKAYEERVKPQEDLTRDIRDKLLLAHDDQLVKEKMEGVVAMIVVNKTMVKAKMVGLKWAVRVNKEEIKGGNVTSRGSSAIDVKNLVKSSSNRGWESSILGLVSSIGIRAHLLKARSRGTIELGIDLEL
ncbi:hypothetical protein E3N88_03987 [Mikania micrantha]|uniref:Zinc finger, CCHC-type n=1 Tax=Mikania micrantha TaxID=192012 RepID=A0A5N6PT33_9ASTR|nr:hypothetical protein E3N88_03987 [Mikania micrantha]